MNHLVIINYKNRFSIIANYVYVFPIDMCVVVFLEVPPFTWGMWSSRWEKTNTPWSMMKNINTKKVKLGSRSYQNQLAACIEIANSLYVWDECMKTNIINSAADWINNTSGGESSWMCRGINYPSRAPTQGESNPFSQARTNGQSSTPGESYTIHESRTAEQWTVTARVCSLVVPDLIHLQTTWSIHCIETEFLSHLVCFL